MVPGPVRQCIHQPGRRAVDAVPVRDRWPRQTGGVGEGGNVQEEVGRAAECRVDEHRVLERVRCQDRLQRDPSRGQVHERARRSAGHVQPDRLARGGQCAVGKRKTKRLGHHLGGGGGPQELASAARCAARAASHGGRFVEADEAVREASADRLDLARVFGPDRRERDPTGNHDARQVAATGQRKQCGRQALVARRDRHDARPPRQ
jgi:hypothetical protein